MIFKKIFLLVLLINLICGWVFVQEKDSSYKIGPEDLIEINVFNVPDLSKIIRVAQDGSINLALIGKINISGLTRFELEKRLGELLEKKYLKNPQVTVFIKEYKSQSISIIGAVRTPGRYNLFGKKSLLDGITMAGGLTDKETGIAVIIRTYKDGSSGSLRIELDKLMLGEDPKLNVPLQAGDILNIPLKRVVSVYVFGQVKQPGEVKVSIDGEPTLLKAIAAAGGFNTRARKRSILVKRIVDGKEQKFKVNALKILNGREKNFVLKNNDIIHIPESVL